MSCRCQECGKLYKVDLIIPDNLWEIIKPKGKDTGAGLLCGSCIMKKIEALGNYDALHVTKHNSRDPKCCNDCKFFMGRTNKGRMVCERIPCKCQDPFELEFFIRKR